MDCPGVDAHTIHTEVTEASLGHGFTTPAREWVEGSGDFPVPPTAFYFLEGENVLPYKPLSPGSPFACPGCRECSRGTLDLRGDSLADGAAGCPGRWRPGYPGRRGTGCRPGCPGRWGTDCRPGCPECRERLARRGTAPPLPSPRGAPGALSSRVAGIDASCRDPHQLFPGPAKVVDGKCPGSRCRSPGRGGAAEQGRGTRTAEPSRAQPSRSEPIRAHQNRAQPSRAS